MTPIADMVKRLIAAGCDPAEAAAVVAEAHALGVNSIPRNSADVSAERRREKDRERKRAKKGNPQISADSAEIPQTAILSKKVSKTKREIHGSRISVEWILPDSYRLWALSKGLSDWEIVGQAERFKDWWLAKAGKDGSKLDWFATWRTWCSSFLEKKGRSSTEPPAMTPAARELVRKTEEYEAQLRKKLNEQKDLGIRSPSDGSGTQSPDQDRDVVFPARKAFRQNE